MSDDGDFRDQQVRDLEDNRKGRLSDRQLAAWHRAVAGRAPGLLGRLLGRQGDAALARDVAAARVDSIEGAIRKQTSTHKIEGETADSWSLDVVSPADQVETFDAAHDLYDAAPEFGLVRLYFLPETRTPVNVELVRVPPIGRVTVDDARALATDMLHALVRGDTYAHGHAVSRMAPMTERMPSDALLDTAPAGPPAAEAVIGRWTASSMTLTFRPDRTLTLHLRSRGDQGGRWTAQPHGIRLHLESTGQDAEVQVDGDTLTLTVNGHHVRLNRDR